MEKGTFNHSVKVPKLYKCAAKISQEVVGGTGSIKQLVYEKTHFNTKALYALVATAIQRSNELDLLLKRTKLLEKETRLDPWLAKILISELLWGKMRLPENSCKPILTILAYEQAFRAHLSDSSWDQFTAESIKSKKPRYIRINTLVTPINEALELFQEEGWTLLPPSKENTYASYLEQVSNLEGDVFLRDFHIPELLAFPGGTEFYNHPGYKKGSIILQDKASCLPVHILSPPPESVVLDMCAAPGMKTTQLAASLQDSGTVYAVERDSKRCEVLRKMVQTAEASCVKIVNQDVLECGDSDFPDVEYILVDPSCSGSGMTDRVEVNPTRDQVRLRNLAGFQIKILRSALSRYPKAKRIVYSTCSLHPEENEDVVRQVLETNYQYKLVPAEQFVDKQWTNFGSPDFGNIGKYCLYARPEEDLTNGFFLAVFEQLEDGENNEFHNERVLNYRKDLDQKQARKERRNNKGGKVEDVKKNPVDSIDVAEDVKNPVDSLEGCNTKDVNTEKNPVDSLDGLGKKKEETYLERKRLKLIRRKKSNKDTLVEAEQQNTCEDEGFNIHEQRGFEDDNKVKQKKKNRALVELGSIVNADEFENLTGTTKMDKKKKHRTTVDLIQNDCGEASIPIDESNGLKKKKRKHSNPTDKSDAMIVNQEEVLQQVNVNTANIKKSKKNKHKVDKTTNLGTSGAIGELDGEIEKRQNNGDDELKVKKKKMKKAKIE